MALAERIYEEMVRKEFKTSKGDEFILSLTVNEMKEIIKMQERLSVDVGQD